MRIALAGSKGQLGWEIENRAVSHGFEISPADLPELDITDRSSVEEWIESASPSVVINAAAYTNVDQAEDEEALAFRVNSDGPANLAAVCSAQGVPLIHLSTDFVFDGTATEPYAPDAPVSPIGAYGRSKAAGDEKIRDRLVENVIVRTSWLYGVHGHNFVKTMLRLGAERDVLGVVDDQSGSPTCAADLAEALLTIAAPICSGADVVWGTYHCCGAGVTTWCGFTRAILDFARQFGSAPLARVEPITTADYPTRAQRPVYSALDCRSLEENFGIESPPWQESLEKTIRQLLA